MSMYVEIISTERIKPTSPTPNYLKKYKLCILDHLIPAPYAPIVIFYPKNPNSPNHSQNLEILVLLKNSLSKTLTRYFPLAGTIKDDLSIDCDDQGACFTTTKVKTSLSEFLKRPDLKIIARFLPEKIEYSVTNIQVNVFDCGGIAIGVCISHRILDGTALSSFLKSWAEASTSPNEIVTYPDFSASSQFPLNDLKVKDASMAMWGSLFKKGQFVTKRFVFDGSAIAELKEKATSVDGRHPTHVETVSAFIWKCGIDSCQLLNFGTKKGSLLTHIVNLRKRAVPNFSENSLGNLIWIASAKLSGEGNINIGFSGLVNEVRNSIAKIDGEYVTKLLSEDGPIMMHEYMKEIEELGCEGVDCFGFSSWCKLGFYDVDFGWGKPVWVSSVDSSGSFFMNLIILMDTRCGNGVEAWVTLDEEEMDVLECNQEFRSFASLNPSPLL